jgi:hypothetical protein
MLTLVEINHGISAREVMKHEGPWIQGSNRQIRRRRRTRIGDWFRNAGGGPCSHLAVAVRLTRCWPVDQRLAVDERITIDR